ncbi:hypothetical protein BO71DRAFT_255622 [Aspergillus ellipticus CBS 707.79]|uniref:Uncharacterized protein n=1 Tax=Aspergillus ellipticus CBS 707.79 TaxID=1448320 RepID=A0A319ER85_9EURO|nr:hypothetical protein BO71DRAFT_255622 [Aspergillus ellipticus CBS 707.79]
MMHQSTTFCCGWLAGLCGRRHVRRRACYLHRQSETPLLFRACRGGDEGEMRGSRGLARLRCLIPAAFLPGMPARCVGSHCWTRHWSNSRKFIMASGHPLLPVLLAVMAVGCL